MMPNGELNGSMMNLFIGHCVVDETPKGWYITYIDRDPEAIRRQEVISFILFLFFHLVCNFMGFHLFFNLGKTY